MKKTVFTIAAAAAMLMSCSVEEADRTQSLPGGETFTITASIEQEPAGLQSKTVLDAADGFKVAWEDEDRLYVQVTDTGRGADPDKLNAYLRYEDVDLKVSHGFGIRNVNERIQLHFGGDSGLTFSIDTNGRLAATLTICTAKKSAPDNKI